MGNIAFKELSNRVSLLTKMIDDDKLECINMSGDGTGMLVSGYSNHKGRGAMYRVPESVFEGACTIGLSTIKGLIDKRKGNFEALLHNNRLVYNTATKTGSYRGELNLNVYQDIDQYIHPPSPQPEFDSNSEFFRRLAEAYKLIAYKAKSIGQKIERTMSVNVNNGLMIALCFDSHHAAMYQVGLQQPIPNREFVIETSIINRLIELAKEVTYQIQIVNNYALYITSEDAIASIQLKAPPYMDMATPLQVFESTLSREIGNVKLPGEELKILLQNFKGIYDVQDPINIEISPAATRISYNTIKGFQEEIFNVPGEGNPVDVNMSSRIAVDFATNFPNELLKLAICGSHIDQSGKDVVIATKPDETNNNRQTCILLKGQV